MDELSLDIDKQISRAADAGDGFLIIKVDDLAEYYGFDPLVLAVLVGDLLERNFVDYGGMWSTQVRYKA